MKSNFITKSVFYSTFLTLSLLSGVTAKAGCEDSLASCEKNKKDYTTRVTDCDQASKGYRIRIQDARNRANRLRVERDKAKEAWMACMKDCKNAPKPEVVNPEEKKCEESMSKQCPAMSAAEKQKYAAMDYVAVGNAHTAARDKLDLYHIPSGANAALDAATLESWKMQCARGVPADKLSDRCSYFTDADGQMS